MRLPLRLLLHLLLAPVTLALASCDPLDQICALTALGWNQPAASYLATARGRPVIEVSYDGTSRTSFLQHPYTAIGPLFDGRPASPDQVVSAAREHITEVPEMLRSAQASVVSEASKLQNGAGAGPRPTGVVVAAAAVGVGMGMVL